MPYMSLRRFVIRRGWLGKRAIRSLEWVMGVEGLPRLC
jgi:hypothetical protein